MEFMIHKGVKTLFINDTEIPVQECETVIRDFGHGEAERLFFYVNLLKLESDFSLNSSKLDKIISKIKVCSIKLGDSAESKQYKQIHKPYHNRDQAIYERVDDALPSEEFSDDPE